MPMSIPLLLLCLYIHMPMPSLCHSLFGSAMSNLTFEVVYCSLSFEATKCDQRVHCSFSKSISTNNLLTIAFYNLFCLCLVLSFFFLKKKNNEHFSLELKWFRFKWDLEIFGGHIHRVTSKPACNTYTI